MLGAYGLSLFAGLWAIGAAIKVLKLRNCQGEEESGTPRDQRGGFCEWRLVDEDVSALLLQPR